MEEILNRMLEYWIDVWDAAKDATVKAKATDKILAIGRQLKKADAKPDLEDFELKEP